MTEDPEAEDAGTDPDVEADESADDAAVDGETQQAADGGTDDDENGNGYGDDETVPHVELELYELSVRVSGQSTDELEDVESSATRLMNFLIDQAKQLEDEPDTRGLS
ncbi:hypothetical protein GJR96_12310 [Haloferax sp. MBLA0076]|uniref:Uncharacterized protein n=1 Tax=Haloferax litoreum TaxID=2666140 RepID=A0A6A8GM36_9EURY|nr:MULTISPECIES: hypothetical protein [Haloferax]KAB1194172.1 hypothetical protein Hfx1148_12250 [Haloferax sp. CBA1148]MRX22730.1 hypothetical protein [Haloferax litoreum]